jgi:ABC-type multidrug transport system fused ATPase/permease subunit
MLPRIPHQEFRVLTEWKRALAQVLSKVTSRRGPSLGWSVLHRLVRESWRKYAGRYVIALALMAVGSAATATIAWMMKDVVNDIFVKRDAAATVLIPCAIAALFNIKGAAAYAQEVWLCSISNKLNAA